MNIDATQTPSLKKENAQRTHGDEFNHGLYEKIQNVLRTADLWSAGPRSSRPHFGQAEYRSRGKLPHLLIENGIYFVTWRLADALPMHVIEQLSSEQALKLRETQRKVKGLGRTARKKVYSRIAKLTEKLLDRGYGSSVLKIPDCAEIVANALNFFDGKRYRMMAWVVMPNHVHTILKPNEGIELCKVIQSWKSYTSKEINKVLGRGGKLWQDEYYDVLIRDHDHLERALLYVANNPVKAGLKDWKWVRIG